ncbi:MAG: S8 family serine peptidase [Saprospiraceae bacterium]|nr:S8 family serine peptidase [Saprospiraceae bacterium]
MKTCQSVIAAAIVAFFAMNAVHAQQPSPGVEQDHYYAQQKRIPVQVYLDRLGVIPASDITNNDMEGFLRQNNFRLERPKEGGFLFVMVPRSSRVELAERARVIKGSNAKLFADVGLVVEAGSPEDPHTMLVSDRFIARFRANVSRAQIDAFNRRNNVEMVDPDRFVRNQYHLRVTRASGVDALRMANLYEDNDLVEFAHPDFWEELRFNSEDVIPNDPMFAAQWHLRNTGQGGGTVDADVDADLAWDITRGNANTLIAILDAGFDIDHEDLAPNLYTNSGEIPGNGIDDDGNGFIDDVNGWDFAGNDNNPRPAAGVDNHGTAVTGVAVARGDNAIGVSGSCPECRFLPLSISNNNSFATTSAIANAFGYAQLMGAEVITNSWGQVSPSATAATAIVNAINNAVTAGSVVLFAGGNSSTAGWCGASYPSLANVIAVSSSSNLDRKVTGHAFGNCIDILAPTRWSPGDPTPTGTLAITTTDRTGVAGYNNANPSCMPGLIEPADRNYTNCFSGTSSATPLVAGIVGLIRSANPSLTPTQVQNLIQDTADKIEPSVGSYNAANGYSSPSTGIATHAFGRANAFEAVKIAAPVADGGKGGVDLFFRDNYLDWGNTEQPSSTLFEPVRGAIGWWTSMDIKVDAPPYAITPPTAANFDAFVDENPMLGAANRVYVRVRNRGPIAASTATVKLHWAQFGTSLPALASDFWTAFPANPTGASSWNALPAQTLTNVAYSGASVAGTGADAAQVAVFTFTPSFAPSLSNHYCLAAMIDSPQDPLGSGFTSQVVDAVTPRNNNVTHRNYVNLTYMAEEGDDFAGQSFFIRNPYPTPIRTVLKYEAPKGWEVALKGAAFNEPMALAAGEERLVTLQGRPTKGAKESGEITVIQEQLEPEKQAMGGATFGFKAGGTDPGIAGPCGCDGVLSAYSIGVYDNRKNTHTIIRLVNPGAQLRRYTVAFLDDNQKFLKCIEGRLGANDMDEIDTRQYVSGSIAGVVKIISKNDRSNQPEPGIAAFKTQYVQNKGFLCKRISIAESVLPHIPGCILAEDYKLILKGCNN